MKLQWFIILAVLIGCSENNVEDINDRSNSATFDFDRVQLVSFETRASDNDWPDIKDEAVVNLSACIIDTQFLERVVGEEFEISSKTTSSNKESNSNGCISWTEEFNFNYINDETYFQLNGVVTGLDNFKGRRSYSLAVNPWAQTVVDLQHGKVNALKPLENTLAQAESDKHLEASRFNITVLEKSFSQDQTKLKLDISTNAEILRRGLDGNLIKIPLTGGSFIVEYLIISRALDTNMRSVLAKEKRELNVRDDGLLRSAVDFELSSGISPNSQIELGIKLFSLDKSEGLGQDEGVVSLTQLEGSMSGDLLNIPTPFNFISSQKMAIDFTHSEFGFVIDNIDIRRGSEGGTNLGGTSSNSEVDALVEARIVDPLIYADIKNHTFHVDLINQETNETLYSNSVSTLSGSGVIKFRATIPFKRYNTRAWKKYILRVSSNQSPYTNITKERVVYINPWISTSDFGIDSNIGTPPQADTENIPEIFIENFAYRFIGNVDESFKLNKNLDLKYEKRLRLEFRPKLKVDHDYSGGANIAFENIVNGKYLLRLLVLAPKNAETFSTTREVNLDEFYTLTADDTEVEVRNGLVSADLDLPLLFTDQLIFATRNLALVELRPIEEDTELKPGYFVGSFVGNKKSGVVKDAEANSLRLSTGNIDIAKQLSSKIESVKSKLENLKSEGSFFNLFLSKLRGITPERPVFNHQNFNLETKNSSVSIFTTERSFKNRNNIKSSAYDIKQMIINPSNTNQRLLSEVCGVMFDKNEKTVTLHNYPRAGAISHSHPTEIIKVGMHYQACKEEPFRFLDFAPLQHVEEITEQPRNPIVDSLTLSRSEAYFLSRGQSFASTNGKRESEYLTRSWNIGAGVEAGKWGMAVGGGFDITKGYTNDFFTVEADSELLGSTNRTMHGNGFTLSYDRFDVEFKALVKSCVFITGKDVQIELPKRYVNHRFLDFLRRKDPSMGIIASPRRLYICSRKRHNIDRRESWYFVSANKSSLMGDESLGKNSMLNVIRGRKNFDNFRENQIETDKVLVIQESDKSSVVDQYEKYLNSRGANMSYQDRLGVGFPGLLTN